MNLTSLQELIDSLWSLSRHQLVLRLTILLSPLLAVTAALVAGSDSFVPLIILVVTSSLFAAARPDSHAAVVTIVAIAWQWFVAVDDTTTPWVLVAALAVLLLHVATAAATIAPPTAELTRSMQARWLRRTAVVAAVTVVAWALTRAFDAIDTPSNVAIATAGALGVVALLALLWPRRSR